MSGGLRYTDSELYDASDDELDDGVEPDNEEQQKLFTRRFPIEWVVADAEIEAAGPRWEDVAPWEKPLPRKLQMAGDAPNPDDWDFVEFIPPWTDPDWKEDIEVDREGYGVGGQVPLRDVFQRLRPAILPQDAMRNPTPSAQRWGINVDRTPQGRSGTSPTRSTTRTVVLDNPESDTGEQSFVTVDDYEQDERAYYARPGPKAPTFQMELQQILNDPNDTGRHKRAQAFSTLEKINEDDKDYQRTLFSNYTTDDLIEQDMWPQGRLELPFDLAGPVHDLLRQEKWISQNRKGDNSDNPRFLYNLGDNRGEYTASDSTVWSALQPALQLVSRVLNTNPNVYQALADIYHLRPVHPSRDPRPTPARGRKRKTQFVSVWAEEVAEEDMFPGARDYHESGYISTVRVVGEILEKTLRWKFGSTRREAETGERTTSASYGQTYVEEDPEKMDSELPFEIVICLGSESRLFLDQFPLLYTSVVLCHDAGARCKPGGGLESL